MESNAEIDDSFLEHYFALDHDFEEILKSIEKDNQIIRAIQRFRGLRIVRQPVWECLISYICSAFSNIKRIRGMIENISRSFGNKLCFEDKVFYSFPSPLVLAEQSVEHLRSCGLGFRAKSVLSTAKKITSDELSLEGLRNLSYEVAVKTLTGRENGGKAYAGVGQKVADCALLFSLAMLEAFPTDVWIRRAVLQWYGNLFDDDFVSRLRNPGPTSLSPRDYRIISDTMREYFGKYAGYAQEYLYFDIRTAGVSG